MPLSPNWLSRSEIGLAPDGAEIVWASLTSLSVTVKSMLTLLTAEPPALAGGSMASDSPSLRRM